VTGGHAVYVYGVVAASERTEIAAPGVGREQGAVRRVTHDGLAALVSEVPRGPLGRARDLRAHWRVLEQATTGATVLPVRFGTVMEDERAVRERFLAPNAEHLTALVEKLAGTVQVSVKASYDEERLLREVVRDSPSVARLRERVGALPKAASYYERIRLGEQVSAEVERRREADTALVLGRLEPLALGARIEPPPTPDTAVNAAFLVHRNRLDEFGRAVAELARELGERLSVRSVGPLPPYAFTDTEATAWA
jgi:hypothetical protein